MRVNFEMNKSQISSLRDLQNVTGASSIRELINNALSIMEWAANETAKGNEIAAVNEQQKTYRVLVSPLLQNAAKRSVTKQGSQVAVGV